MYAVMLSMVCVAIVSIIGIFGVVEVKSKCHIFKKNYLKKAMQIQYINEIDVLFLGKKWANLPFHRVFNLHVLLPPDSCNRYHLMGC